MTTAILNSVGLPGPDAASDLCRHLQQCHSARGRWFAAAMLAEQMHALLAPRFATTVALAIVLPFLVFM